MHCNSSKCILIALKSRHWHEIIQRILKKIMSHTQKHFILVILLSYKYFINAVFLVPMRHSNIRNVQFRIALNTIVSIYDLLYPHNYSLQDIATIVTRQ
jgi:hypothetical protein